MNKNILDEKGIPKKNTPNTYITIKDATEEVKNQLDVIDQMMQDASYYLDVLGIENYFINSVTNTSEGLMITYTKSGENYTVIKAENHLPEFGRLSLAETREKVIQYFKKKYNGENVTIIDMKVDGANLYCICIVDRNRISDSFTIFL